jgi:hypothetical protein
MNFIRIGLANCGHITGGLAVAHGGLRLCPPCAAHHWYQDNVGLICEEARRALAERRRAEAVALCLMALEVGPRDCSPCACRDCVEAAR